MIQVSAYLQEVLLGAGRLLLSCDLGSIHPAPRSRIPSYVSLTTFNGSLSSRNATNLVCLR